MLFSNIVDPSLTVSEGHRIGEEVLKRLNQDIDEATDLALHYLGGKVRIEARIPLDAMSDLEQARRFTQEMAQTAYKDEYVTEVRVLFY